MTKRPEVEPIRQPTLFQMEAAEPARSGRPFCLPGIFLGTSSFTAAGWEGSFFRQACFRNTWLRNYTSTPPGVLKFWMGHAGEDMSDLYDKIKSDVAFRKEVAKKAGLGFELPSKICVIGRNGRKIESAPVLELAASA